MQTIEEKLQRIIKELSTTPLIYKDFLVISSLSKRLAEECDVAYAKSVFETIVNNVPNEIWAHIFNFSCIDLSKWPDLMQVSKQWCHNIPKAKRAIFNSHMIFTPRSTNRLLAKFPHLLSFKTYCRDNIDYTLLTNLTKLTLTQLIKPDSLHCLSVLTSLKSLSFLGNNFIYDETISSIPEPIKLNITSLNISRNIPITDKGLMQFSNLTMLNIEDNHGVKSLNSLPLLRYLKATQFDFIRLSDYTGYARIDCTSHRDYLSNYVYYGNVLNGKFNGHGTCRFSDGDSYIGSFKDSQKHGLGTYHYALGSNKSSIEGEWKCDKLKTVYKK